MINRKKLSALKHGAFTVTALLPGESAAALQKLQQELIAEWVPNGAFEHATVAHLGHLLWRRRNLGTFRLAAFVQRRSHQLRDNLVTMIDQPKSHEASEFSRGFIEKCRTAEAEARKHFGDELYGLAEMGDQATLDHLMKELAVQERLDGMIERCIKNLMLARGLKSLSIAPASTSPADASKLIEG